METTLETACHGGHDQKFWRQFFLQHRSVDSFVKVKIVNILGWVGHI